jgi:chemotaxis protein CheD
MEIVVSISDMKVTNRGRDVLVTHALGSCLGLAAYDPGARVAGLIHCLLPLARESGNGQVKNPFMYVNTGVPQMMRSLFHRGATRENLILKAAGCGRMMHISNQFDTGANNLGALRKLLQINEMVLAAEDVGGTIPRTMRLFADTGRVVISSCGRSWEL